MKIALVIGRYDAAGGGAERWTDRHARLLRDRGHEVHLVAHAFSNPPKGVCCHTIDSDRPVHLRSRSRFAASAERFLHSLDVDVIVDMGDGWYCDVFMPHHGTRIAGFHQNTRLLPPLLRPLRELTRRWLPRYRQFTSLEERQYDLDSATTFVALSNMVREHMREYHHVPDERIGVVHNGVDVRRFRPAADDRARKAQRRKLRFGDQTTVYLIVAHNFKLKGVDALMQAMGDLLKAGRDVGLIVVGDGQIHRYQRKAQSLGCASVVRFVGDRNDPRPFYHAADVYVQPTFYDPCSLVVLEALACGLPVITTRMNGAGELITPYVEGIVLDTPGDVVDLTDAMANYLDRRRRQDASRAARRLAEQNTLERNTDRLVGIYQQIGRVRSAA